MSASDYFKAAAANIRRAIEHKKAEINDIRSQLEIKKTETNKEVQRVQTEARAKEADISRRQENQSEPGKDRATKLKEVGEAHTYITNLQHSLTQLQEQASGQIRAIEQDLTGLEQLAGSLEAKN